jgi:hypothetical protein
LKLIVAAMSAVIGLLVIEQHGPVKQTRLESIMHFPEDSFAYAV